jgi:transposase
MGYKPHPPLGPRLIGYDPLVELPSDHLARFIDEVVEAYIDPPEKQVRPGQPEYDPRPLLKALLFAYATGVFSSRRIEKNCYESLPYMLLVRDDRPSYRAICSARIKHRGELIWLWYCLFDAAVAMNVKFVGKIYIDSSKFKADVSKESVVSKRLMLEVRQKLEKILEQAEGIDEAEDEEGLSVHSQTGVEVKSLTMRKILREVKKPTEPTLPKALSPKMKERVQEAVETLKFAQEEGLKHVSLTDPDACMMALGSHKTISMGYSLEVASEEGLLVHAETIQQSSDTGRLPAVVDTVDQNGPCPVTEVIADSGYYRSADILALQDGGYEVVVPDASTACDLKRGDPIGTASGKAGTQIAFTGVPGRDAFVCPQGNVLTLTKRWSKDGLQLAQYRASRSCTECPLAKNCLRQSNAQRRTIRISEHRGRLDPYLASFAEPDVQERYHQRGPCVETVFAVLRRTLGFDRWHVRGALRVAAEAKLLASAYQLRKLHTRWAMAR